MFVKQIRVESLGNSSYLVGSREAKVCAVIDPLRDVALYTQEAEALGVQIIYSLETHVHNDFISGSRELAARTGATVCASAAGGLLLDHRPLVKGDSIDLGEVRLDVIATPGHTPEHISFLATDTTESAGPVALFSGGALLVGGVARTLPGTLVPPDHSGRISTPGRQSVRLPHPWRRLFLPGVSFRDPRNHVHHRPRAGYKSLFPGSHRERVS